MNGVRFTYTHFQIRNNQFIANSFTHTIIDCNEPFTITINRQVNYPTELTSITKTTLLFAYNCVGKACLNIGAFCL